MNLHQIEEMSQYLRYLEENPYEIDLLFNEFLINVTHFFRDLEAFESLKQDALNEIIKEKLDSGILRIWVPGCSTGEEVNCNNNTRTFRRNKQKNRSSNIRHGSRRKLNKNSTIRHIPHYHLRRYKSRTSK
jgi:hypothetical protein